MKQFEEKILGEAALVRKKKPSGSQGSVAWKSPSNIAIVKYWGKRPGQIPANASFSLTLSRSHTITSIDYTVDASRKAPSIEFLFEGQVNDTFSKRVEKYLDSIKDFLPWLRYSGLKIHSENTFPHSTGIASSASAMSALSVCLCDIEREIYGEKGMEDFLRKASFLSRLGSGSASRSIYGPMAEWGSTSCLKESSDEYAIPVTNLHAVFSGLRDSILIIEKERKKVSSSFGHELMKTNPYAKLRFEAAEENMRRLCRAMKQGDLNQFIDIMENEALSLHAMMMTSSPGYLLMRPNTLEAIERLRTFRLDTGHPVGFTLDAGANLHVIYPEVHEDRIRAFIESDLKELCTDGRVIHDEAGMGPEKQ